MLGKKHWEGKVHKNEDARRKKGGTLQEASSHLCKSREQRTTYVRVRLRLCLCSTAMDNVSYLRFTLTMRVDYYYGRVVLCVSCVLLWLKDVRRAIRLVCCGLVWCFRRKGSLRATRMYYVPVRFYFGLK